MEITWDETADVAGRAEFYDRTGALRDMVQSHLLQLLALLTMEDLPAFDERSLRDAKVRALRSVRSPTPDDVLRDSVRARYVHGHAGRRSVEGYAQHRGVDEARGTETYVSLRLWLDDPRWTGVPFLLRTGKALREDRRLIDVRFRPAADRAGLAGGGVNRLRLRMAPDEIVIGFNASGTTGLPDLVPVEAVARPPRQVLPASARVLLDLLRGDPVLTVRDDEAEECWRIVDPVLSVWRTGVPPLQEYRAGDPPPHGLEAR